MQFDRIEFLAFFAIFLFLYHALGVRFRLQNILILIGSAFFYGWWNWRFLGLIFLSAAIDYVAGIYLERPVSQSKRKLALTAALVGNILILGYFKYYNFFLTSLVDSFHLFGKELGWSTMKIILPMGISFHTFQSMAYSISVYSNRIRAEKNPITYFAFVTFFPQLVAGPIERAEKFLPQFNRVRQVSEADVREGLWMMAWGFFLKIVIANRVVPLVGLGFRADQQYGWMTVLGVLAFTLQIYCDFNGYSLIARGSAKLLGFDLMWNFNLPYFSKTVQEFWRRWHISLSEWFRDFLYIPLVSRAHARKWNMVLAGPLAVILVMSTSGLWHGASWHFVLFGAWHGLAVAIYRLYRRHWNPFFILPSIVSYFLTMVVVCIGWFFFRVDGFDMGYAMVKSMKNWQWFPQFNQASLGLGLLAALIFPVELWQFKCNNLLAPARLGRFSFSLLVAFLIGCSYFLFANESPKFIYFEF
jgi:alginate O-acetyltransferase complex protein AlgI